MAVQQRVEPQVDGQAGRGAGQRHQADPHHHRLGGRVGDEVGDQLEVVRRVQRGDLAGHARGIQRGDRVGHVAGLQRGEAGPGHDRVQALDVGVVDRRGVDVGQGAVGDRVPDLGRGAGRGAHAVLACLVVVGGGAGRAGGLGARRTDREAEDVHRGDVLADGRAHGGQGDGSDLLARGERDRRIEQADRGGAAGVPARRGGQQVGAGGGAGVDPVGERDRRRAAGAVGVADRERSGGGPVRGGADHAEDGAGPGQRDGLAVGDHVVRVAGRNVGPGDRHAVVQQRLAGRERVLGQARCGERVADAIVVPGRGIRRRGDAHVVERLLQGGRRRGRRGMGGERGPGGGRRGGGRRGGGTQQRRSREQGRDRRRQQHPPGSPHGAPPHGGRRCGVRPCLTCPRLVPASPGDGLAVALAVTRPAALFFKRFRLSAARQRKAGRAGAPVARVTRPPAQAGRHPSPA